MSEAKQAVFDSSRSIEIRLQSAEGSKSVKVRFPTDDEWIERARKRKIIIKQLGRGMSETIVPSAEDIDAELLAKIRIGDGPEIDAFEASRILEQLGEAEVEDVETGGGAFRVILRVPGGVTAHLLRMPSARDVIQYRRSFARVIDLPYNRQQLTVNLNAAGELYAKLRQEVEGYEGAVPVIHQAAALKAAIEALDAGFGVAGSENF